MYRQSVEALRRLAGRVDELSDPIRRCGVPMRVRHTSGPREFEAGPTDVVVVSVVRDGADHVETFLDHHFGLGVRHVVLLDNGSVDQTVALAKAFNDVTVLETTLPYKRYKYLLKRYLFDRFGHDGWCLIVDIDERFDFPMSDRISLTDFLVYLNQERYTGVIAQMLDLFAEGPPRGWPQGGKDLAERCHWYDISALQRTPYPAENGNDVSSSTLRLYYGGVRKLMFGVDVALSKHPLLYGPGGPRPSLSSAHECSCARIADVSCVLLHYKFDRRFGEKCELAVQRRNYSGESWDYKAYLAGLRREPDLALKGVTAARFETVEQLLDTGFIVASQKYREFARNRQRASSTQMRGPAAA